MVSKKGPIFTIDAFRRAAVSMPDASLEMIGAGPLLPAAWQFVTTFDLEKNVFLRGEETHEAVLAALSKADIFIQHNITDPYSGDQEGLPVALLEAMAHGLGVVSTWHSGIPDAVQDGETGFLVKEGDTKTMADRIQMLALDSHLRDRIGNAAWTRVHEEFTWDVERRRLLEAMGLSN